MSSPEYPGPSPDKKLQADTSSQLAILVGLNNFLQYPKSELYRLVVDGAQHQNGQGWLNYDKTEPGSVQGVFNAFEVAIKHIGDKELSLALIIEIHRACISGINTNIYKNTDSKEKIDQLTNSWMKISLQPFTLRGMEYLIKNLVSQSKKTNSPSHIGDHLIDDKYLPNEKMIETLALQTVVTSSDFDFNTDLFILQLINDIIFSFNNKIKKDHTNSEKIPIMIDHIKQLELLHPFRDGNTRTFTVVLLNWMLMREGLPLATFYNPNTSTSHSESEFLKILKESMENTLSLQKNKQLFGFDSQSIPLEKQQALTNMTASLLKSVYEKIQGFVNDYKKHSETNDVTAQYSLGFCYANGIGLQKDLKQAAALKYDRNMDHLLHFDPTNIVLPSTLEADEKRAKDLMETATKGNLEAEYALGLCYAQGCGVQKNYDLALKWFENPAAQGHAKAQYHSATIFFRCRDDREKAIALFEKAAQQGHAEAQIFLANLFINDKETEPKAAALYMAVAKQQPQLIGDQGALFLAKLYEEGIGVAKNEAEAVKWYLKITNHHVLSKEQNLFIGICYAESIGVDKDDKKAIEYFKIAAEKKDANAQYHLGCFYATGRAVEKNKKQAMEYFQMALQQKCPEALNALKVFADSDKDPLAQYYLGCLYEEGLYVEKNEKQAIEYFQMAAAQKNTKAQYHLGCHYFKGIGGINQDYKKAFEYFSEVAKHELNLMEPEPISFLGCSYAEGHFVTQDHKKAIEYFSTAAQRGNFLAQYHLGTYYEKGNIVEQNPKNALELYMQAAKNWQEIPGEPLLFIAGCYQNGIGIEKDERQVFVWYEKAAHKGCSLNNEQLLFMGRCYNEGIGTIANRETAFTWYSKPELQENSLAQYALGSIYESKVEYENAILWYKKAAKQDHAEANFKVGFLLDKITDETALDFYTKAAMLGWAPAQQKLARYYIKTEPKKAFEWMQISAQQGFHSAQSDLGYLYLSGIGVEQDNKKAVEWFMQAIRQGNEKALINLKAMSNDGDPYAKDNLINYETQNRKPILFQSMTGVDNKQKLEHPQNLSDQNSLDKPKPPTSKK